jgi:hypothetical protein
MRQPYIIDCENETQAGTLKQWFQDSLRTDVPVTQAQICVDLESHQVAGLRHDHGINPCPVEPN